MSLFNMNKWKWKTIIAAYEIIGGLLGISTVALSISSFLFNPFIAAIGIFFALLFLLSICAGVLLWKNDTRGIDLSIIAQLPQTLQLALPGLFSYSFISGLAFSLTMAFEEIDGSNSSSISLGFNGASQLSLNSEGVFLIGINFIAIALIMYLEKLRRMGFQVSPEDNDIDYGFNGNNGAGREKEDQEVDEKKS